MNCHHQTECEQWLCWKYSGLFSRLSSFLCHPINNLMFELVGRGHKREEGAQVSLQRDSPLRDIRWMLKHCWLASTYLQPSVWLTTHLCEADEIFLKIQIKCRSEVHLQGVCQPTLWLTFILQLLKVLLSYLWYSTMLSANHNIIIHDILRYKIFYNIHIHFNSPSTGVSPLWISLLKWFLSTRCF